MMFDSQTTAITKGIAWVSILLYAFALLYTLINYKKWARTSEKWVRNLFWLLFFVVYAVTYAIDSDFFHYKDMVYSTREILDYGLETVYQYIILFLNNNYFLFRVVVFGGAVLVYSFVLSRYDIDKTVGVLLMLIIFGGIFSYARATLAFSIYYLGLSFLVTNDEKRKRSFGALQVKPLMFAIGIGLILSSYLFHRSMLFLIALTPSVFVKLSRKGLYAIAFLSPLILFALRGILGNVFELLSFDAVIDQRINDVYSEAVEINANWLGFIGQVLHYGKYLLCYILISISLYRHIGLIDKRILHLFSYYVVLSYVALLSYPLFDGNIVYMHRFLNMSIVPIIIIISYLYKHRFMQATSLMMVVYWSIANSFLSFARYIF